MSNCPNCGALVKGYKCEYCETIFTEVKNEEDELTKMVSDYCDSLDAWEKDYKRMMLDLRKLADECSRANKWIDWTGTLGTFISITFTGVVIALTLFGLL